MPCLTIMPIMIIFAKVVFYTVLKRFCMSKLNIAITINYLAVGGSQTFALGLAQGLSDLGHTVFVYDFNLPFTTRSLNDLDSPLLRDKNFELVQYEAPLNTSMYHLFLRVRPVEIITTYLLRKSRVRKFRKFVKLHKIQVVSSHLMAADTLTALAVRYKNNITHCATMHGSYEGFPSVLKKRIREIVFGRVDGIIYLTKKNIDFLDDLKNKNQKLKIKQIYNGYIPQTFDAEPISRREIGIPDDAFVFVQVARGTEDKGWNESILAFLSVKQKTDKNVWLFLIGDGDYLSSLKSKYQKTGNNIVFYGYSGNPIPLIKICNVGILPTYYKGESLPNSIIEYINLSLPVIGSDIGEIANMIGAYGEQPAGVIVPRIDEGPVSVEKLTELMENYVNNKGLYVIHKGNTILQYTKFDMQSCASSYEKYFNELLKVNL